jgi:hypothetical protein
MQPPLSCKGEMLDKHIKSSFYSLLPYGRRSSMDSSELDSYWAMFSRRKDLSRIRPKLDTPSLTICIQTWQALSELTTLVLLIPRSLCGMASLTMKEGPPFFSVQQDGKIYLHQKVIVYSHCQQSAYFVPYPAVVLYKSHL